MNGADYIIGNAQYRRSRRARTFCYHDRARSSPKGDRTMLEGFKKFAVRGNVVDMAVGIIIGAAFGKIVDSLVKDLIMPPIGLLLGKVDFANLFIVMKDGASAGPYLSVEAAQKAGAVTFNYGQFINTCISFVIVAFAVFLLIRAINRLKTAEPPAAPPPTAEEVVLLREIRDALKK
jgi:large conductance mechanosensitive channel